MIIYSDVFSNDKILDYSYPAQELYGCILEVGGSYVITDEETQRMEVDIERNFSLCQTEFTLRSYQEYMKGYSKRLYAYLEAIDLNRALGFAAGFKYFYQPMLATFNEYQFFYGKSKDPTAMIILRKLDGDIARFYYFQDGLKRESVD